MQIYISRNFSQSFSCCIVHSKCQQSLNVRVVLQISLELCDFTIWISMVGGNPLQLTSCMFLEFFWSVGPPWMHASFLRKGVLYLKGKGISETSRFVVQDRAENKYE